MPDEVKAVHERASCLFERREVQAALDRLAAQVSDRLLHSNPILLCVMTGAIVTVAELARRLQFPLQIDYVHATRYGNSTRGAELQWLRHPSLALEKRTVLVVDDIFDQGITLEQIVNYCQRQGAAEVLSAVLVDKLHEHKQSSMQVNFVGLHCPDRYIYGYGMDYKGYLRNVDGIYAVADVDL